MYQKTLIAVMSCAKYPERRAAVRDTWAGGPLPAGVDLRFFRGLNPVESFQPAEPGLVILMAHDGYFELPEKTLALVRYAYERDYTRLIKVDDDTYLLLPDALDVLSSGEYVGCKRTDPPHNKLIAYAQGGCYSLSRRAMKAVIEERSIFGVGLEDGTVGRALHYRGIPVTHSDRIKTDYRMGYPQPSNLIVAAHHVTPAVMLDIHIQTYKGYLSCLHQSRTA